MKRYIRLNYIYLYLMLPIFIFLVCWTKWYIAVPATVILLRGLVCMSKFNVSLWRPEWTRDDKEKMIFCIGIILLWVYLSGIGAFVYQNRDHICRNAIFNTLVEKPWPVISQMEIDGVTTERSLVYYIGFWLPSALVGKVFGLRAGYCAQALWAAIGITIFYYLICCIRKKISVWPLLVFIFFSGLDVVGYFITNTDTSNWTNALHIEWWGNKFQFSSFTTQLFWVFNQALPVWIITALMYLQKNNRYMVVLLGLAMLTSTLPFIGLIPFFLYFVLSREYDGVDEEQRGIRKFANITWWKSFIKDTFTFENVCCGGLVGILSFLYLKGNSAGKLIGETVQDGNLKGYLLLYTLFIILEVGVYFVAIYKYQGNKVLYYFTFICLCICPLVTIGYAYDFSMRASIPALVILYIMVIESMSMAKDKKKYPNLIVIITLLLIGSITARNEIVRTISMTVDRYKNHVDIIDEPETFDNLMISDNFSGYVVEDIWGRYILK